MTTAVEAGDAAPRVLVLDDEPMILIDIECALEDEGALFVGARTVREALNYVEQHVPDVAILDVNLGRGETCAPVAERLRELGVPFVLFTGDLDRKGEPVSGLGGNVIPKPTPGHLVAQRALELTREQQRDR